MTLNSTHTCTIESVAYGGDGVARIEGCVVFVPGALPGEQVIIRITHCKKTFARAHLLGITTPSPHRMDPCCRVFDMGVLTRVPGCVYDHLTYPMEVLIKQQQLTSFFRHIPHEETIFHPPVASPKALHYRNKITLHADVSPTGSMKLGYREEPSHRVVDIPACPLAHPAINDALHALRLSGDLKNLVKHGDDLIFRYTLHDGVIWRNSKGATSPGCPSYLTVQSPVGELIVPHSGFYQVNRRIAELLFAFTAEVFEERQDCPEILDLYCGVGVFGLTCMKHGGRCLTGVESGRASIAAAKENAATHGIPAKFLVHALGLEPLRLHDWLINPSQTTLIIDPPREGIDRSVAEAIAESAIPRIFYISCDPATLTRDLQIILSKGARRIRQVRLFDMFPRTARFETFVEISS